MLKGVRIKECRESECLSVIERIEIEILSHAKTGRLLRGLSLPKFVRKLNTLEANRICSLSVDMCQAITRNSEIIAESNVKIMEFILWS